MTKQEALKILAEAEETTGLTTMKSGDFEIKFVPSTESWIITNKSLDIWNETFYDEMKAADFLMSPREKGATHTFASMLKIKK